MVKRLVIKRWQIKAEQGVVGWEGIGQVFGEPVRVCSAESLRGQVGLVLLALVWSVVATATVVVVEVGAGAGAGAGVRWSWWSSWGLSESVVVDGSSGGS